MTDAIVLEIFQKERRLFFHTGAGGVHLMFNARSTERLRLLDNIKTNTVMLRVHHLGRTEQTLILCHAV